MVKLSLKSLSEEFRSFREDTSKKMKEQNRIIEEQASEIKALRKYLTATRERVAQLEDTTTDSSCSKISNPNADKPPPATPASAAIAEEKGRWEEVKNRTKVKSPRPYAEVASPCPEVKNKFDKLSLEEGEIVSEDETVDGRPSQGKAVSRSVLVLGDSNVRRLDGPLKKILKPEIRSKVRVESFSGIGTDRLIDKVSTELKKEKSSEVKLFVHVGTNDMALTKTQVLLSKLARLVKTAKDARSGVSVDVCKVPSRTDKSNYIYSRSESVNSQLVRLCRENGATCVELGNYSLSPDGIHYSVRGAQTVSHKIAESINSFLG